MHKQSHLLWADYVRVLGTIGVVFLHSAFPLLYKYNDLPATCWMVGNTYDSMVRMSVPLFFMLSGYLLLQKKEPIVLFFKKRFKKVLIPLIFWTLFYIFWKSFYENSCSISFYSFYSAIFTPSYGHLWFLYAIVGIYLYLPFLRIIVEKIDSNLVFYYLVLWFVAVSVIPFGERISGIDSKIDLLSISGYSGYLMLGLFLGKIRITIPKIIISATAICICYFIAIFGTYFLTIHNKGVFDGYFYDNLSPNTILLSAATFILIKYIATAFKIFEAEPAKMVVKSINDTSLGIYLIHPVFLYLLKVGDFGFSISGSYGHPVYSIPLTAVLTFALSYVTILLFRKVKLLNAIVP